MADGGCDLGYLLGVLNGPVADYVFRRLGAPKQGGWYEANKQFIAPLPVPLPDAATQRTIGAQARALQESWTRRRELMREADERLSVLARQRRDTRWLWTDLPALDDLVEAQPRRLSPGERLDKARADLAEMEAERLEILQAVLDSGARLDVTFDRGELRLTAGGAAVLSRIYLDAADGAMAAAFWRHLLLSTRPRDAGKFAGSLRRPPVGADSPAARQFMEKVAELAAEAAAIREAEAAMNEALYGLYKLTPDERAHIEKDCAARPLLP